MNQLSLDYHTESALKIYKLFNQWNQNLNFQNVESNTTTCCELLEANAKLQHYLFKLLRILVSQGNISPVNDQTRLGNVHLMPNNAYNISEETKENSLYSSQKSLNMNTNVDHLDNSQHIQMKRLNTCIPLLNSSENNKYNTNMSTLLNDPLYSGVNNYANEDSAINPVKSLRSWLSPLVKKYNDLFTNLRVVTMERLQKSGQNDFERNQRLIFHAVQCAFFITRKLVLKLDRLSSPTTNEIGCEHFQSQMLFADVPLNSIQIDNLVVVALRRLGSQALPVCACQLNSDNTFCYKTKGIVSQKRRPPTANELRGITNLLRECICLAWFFLKDHSKSNDTHIWHVDVDRRVKSGDSYNDVCYRRCHDSDPTAGQVHHYIWPCLILFSRPSNYSREHVHVNTSLTLNHDPNIHTSVLVKGELCTRNPRNFASQRDKAAALINYEASRIVYPSYSTFPRTRSLSYRRY